MPIKKRPPGERSTTGTLPVPGLVRELVPVVTLPPLAVPQPKEIDVPCGKNDAVVSTNDPPANASVSVTNRGDCDLSVTLTGQAGTRGSVAISAGDSGSIASSGVVKVEIDCQGGGSGPDPRCKFGYSITWS